MNYRILVALSGILAIICLFTPFIWMEVGPLGHKFYGPTVPDVYIYGGDITGKDKSFWVIGAMAAFQLIFMVLFCVLAFVSCVITNRQAIIVLLILQSVLLALFTVWLELYVVHVKHNSDGADLTIRYQFGMVLYLALVVLNVLGLILAVFSKRFKKPD